METQLDSQQKSLKNNFQTSFLGLNLFVDDQNPITITRTDGSQSPVSLVSWQEDGPTAFTMFLEQDIALQFSVNSDGADEFLSLKANLPENVENLSIPYKPSSGYLVTEQDDRRAIISSKSQQFEAMAAEISANRLTLTGKEQVATYSTFDPLLTFEFSMVASLPLSAETTYLETIKKLKSDFIQLASQSISDSSTEHMIVAYIAAMAENHQYREALAKIPNSIKTSSRRTYLSAPYFNTLSAMNSSLVRHMENRHGMIDYAIQQRSLDIYTIQDLAELLCTMEGNDSTTNLLSIPASLEEFAPTTAQAAGIINTYTRLFTRNKAMAEQLEVVLDDCLNTIASSCMVEDNIIRLEENKAALPLLDSVSVGMSLISYGQLTGNQDYKATGYLIINSYITNEVSSNIHIMTELYPIIAPNNPYYPHIQIIANAATSGNNKPIWAWTVARDTSFSKDAAGNVTLTFDFPSAETHHAIINGIRPFVRIDIYDIAFRTDPRFEAYSSSGYAYDAETQTMFLKSLHKIQEEDIRLYYSTPRTEPEPEPPAQEAAYSVTADTTPAESQTIPPPEPNSQSRFVPQ
ncbi:MAG: hypothetical protein IKB33_07795 [Spirochaetaceae bacterium]|nr:hypothetical protein [Spirochaetaceae bacterium]